MLSLKIISHCTMDAPLRRQACKSLSNRAWSSRPQIETQCRQQRRWMATPTSTSSEIRAAAPIRFGSRDGNSFRRDNRDNRGRGFQREEEVQNVRIVPASPSYFTATPKYTDDLLELTALLRRYTHLPLCAPDQRPLVTWKSFSEYTDEINEPVRPSRWDRLLAVIKRLNQIHPPLVPGEVTGALARFKRTIQPFAMKIKPRVMDRFGRIRAVGRRKTSNAQCWLVEGDGQVIVNGRTLTEYFKREQDRVTALWALQQTERMDKYNVWAILQGGGLTGQAEAMAMGIAKALVGHERALKPNIIKSGCLSRDMRKVERKKAGKVKARKMPQWRAR